MSGNSCYVRGSQKILENRKELASKSVVLPEEEDTLLMLFVAWGLWPRPCHIIDKHVGRVKTTNAMEIIEKYE
jgi:hypothetical protein